MAGPSAALRFAQDDNFWVVWKKAGYAVPFSAWIKRSQSRTGGEQAVPRQTIAKLPSTTGKPGRVSASAGGRLPKPSRRNRTTLLFTANERNATLSNSEAAASSPTTHTCTGG